MASPQNSDATSLSSPLPGLEFASASDPHLKLTAISASTPSVPPSPAVTTGVHVTVHGHFYQPPRENPYLNAIERQPSAAPFHDWNERIHHECYRPNAFARVLNDRGELVGIVNNYEYLSFNIGATLMSWLERYDLETYQRILSADRQSCARLNGHGNAIAQVYNHMIMPLANERDKYTQIRWGKADFQSRFGRDPEGMWLAETAVDYATLEALIAEDIRFIVLAPSQAQRCRPLRDPDRPQWQDVGSNQIDPSRPYRCFLPDGNPNYDYIDIFFYDGPISRDMGFNNVLSSSQHFAERIGQAVRGDQRSTQLISVATDGETFGHHRGGTEKALAYAFTQEFPQRGWTVTNYAHYLSLHSPSWEVELKPVTAWSCAHGVDRWQDDCGCGGGGVWNQKWRRPLRDALNWLRDQLIRVYEETGTKFFIDPWQARDEYIQVMGDRSIANINRFLAQHQVRKLAATERVDALRLLEMQRHALLMYTSCGWFFEEVSRPEGTQILRYAARALELAGDVAGVQLEKAFVKRLAVIPSNVDCFKHGAEVYRQLVEPAQIGIEQVAAHYAIGSLLTTHPQEQRIYCYATHQSDYQLQRMGALTLAIGQLQLTSEMTRECVHLVFAVLHLGGWDFHCCIQPFTGRRTYSHIKETLFEALKHASAAQTILAMGRFFGDSSYNLQTLFAEERHRIMQLLSQETLTRVEQLYTQVYRDNYGVLMAFHRDDLAVPPELQVAAEIALGHRAVRSLQALEREASDFPTGKPELCFSYLTELETIAIEARHLRCQLKLPELKQILERLVRRSLHHLLYNFDAQTAKTDRQWIDGFQPGFAHRLIDLGNQLQLNLSLDRAQELYWEQFQSQILPQLIALRLDSQAQSPQDRETCIKETCLDIAQLQQLLRLGQKLAIDMDGWLNLLS